MIFLSRWFAWVWALPAFATPLQQRHAHVVRLLVLGITLTILVALGIGVPFIFVEKFFSTIALVFALVLLGIIYLCLRLGKVYWAGQVLLGGLWFITTALLCISGGVRSYYLFFYLSGIPLAGILFGTRGTAYYAFASLIAAFSFTLIALAGVSIPQLFAFPAPAIFVILLINVIFVIIPFNINLQETSQAIEQAEREVAERQRAEQVLRDNQHKLAEREERYRLISTVTSDYMFSTQLNAAGNLQLDWVAGAFEAITGYTFEEYVSQGGWLAALHPEDREKDALDIATLRTNKPIITEVRTINKNGDIHWVRVYAHPLWDETQNQLRGIYGAVQEITKQKEASLERDQHAQEIFVLYKLGQAIAAGQDLYETLNNLLEEIRELFAMTLFYVGIYDAEKEEVSFPLVFRHGQIIQIPPRSLKQFRGLAGEVIYSGKTLFLPDMLDENTRAQYQPSPLAAGLPIETRSFIGVPLKVRGRVFGLMTVHNQQPYFYNYMQVHLLEAIATQASVFIDRALLIEQLQRELAERTRTEKEKELLLKEVHHRVKNNLQVIVSLINLQTAQLTDEKSLLALRESQNRVRSMALVHEKLYQSQSLAQINFRDYLRQLTMALFHSYQTESSQVELRLEADEITLDVDRAVPCGLIVNELVSNALKHGFPQKQQGVITVTLRHNNEGQIELTISDNGVGIPLEKNWRQTESLGMQLVQSLVKQIGGIIELERLMPGTRFSLQFNPMGK